MNKKSVADTLFDFVLKYVKHSKKNFVSTKQAAEIQKKYIEDTCTVGEKNILPYLEVARQLDNTKPEIFNASLYYLEKIAINHPQIKTQILEILSDFDQKNNKSDREKNAVKACIERISGIQNVNT